MKLASLLLTVFLWCGFAHAAPLNVMDGCNGPRAVADGIADDSAAIAACMTVALAAAAQGRPEVVYLPAGIYRLKATPLPLMSWWGVKILGDGSHKTYIQVDPAYVGDVFAWDEAWAIAAFNGPTLNPSADHAGASLVGVTISGDTRTTNVQNAVVFYDREDAVYVQDVSVYLLNGACLKMGVPKYLPEAYVRESSFYALSCFNTGTVTQAAVEISSTTELNSDATNELHFFGLNIFAARSIGLLIHNPNNFSATRLIDIHGLRVEQSGADNFDLGLPSDLGATNEIYVYGFESMSPGGTTSGFYGANLGLGSVQGYDIRINGAEIGPCLATCYGLRIDNVRLTSVEVGAFSTSGTNVTYTARTGAHVVLDGHGLESSFTYSVPGTVTVPAWNTFTP